MKSTTIEIACIIDGKVTQGNWIVSEKTDWWPNKEGNTLVFKSRLIMFAYDGLEIKTFLGNQQRT